MLFLLGQPVIFSSHCNKYVIYDFSLPLAQKSICGRWDKLCFIEIKRESLAFLCCTICRPFFCQLSTKNRCVYLCNILQKTHKNFQLQHTVCVYNIMICLEAVVQGFVFKSHQHFLYLLHYSCVRATILSSLSDQQSCLPHYHSTIRYW